MKSDEAIDKILKLMEVFKDDPIPIIFSSIQEFADNKENVHVKSAFSGNYDHVVVMLATVVNQLHEATDAPHSEIFLDLIRQAAVGEANKIDEEGVSPPKKHMKKFTVIDGKKSDK